MVRVRVDGVSKSFHGVEAVRDVAFELVPGEVFALLGPNGAGKTSLIRMLLDIIRPDRGEVRFDGRPLDRPGRDRIGYLPEERGLYRRARVLEVLEYLGRLKGMGEREAHEGAAGLLERFGLAAQAAQRVETLSKGMQQKVQLLSALVHRPQVLILDEPFSGLDPVNVRQVSELVRERAGAGCTVLLSTHRMEQVEALCDRLLMIHRGRVVLEGPLAEVRSRHSENAVWVRGAHPGVAGLEVVERARVRDARMHLTLREGVRPADFLRAAVAAGLELESLEPAVTPLEDIFVRLAGEG
ncbi:MAG: ATP-binding cassette domain-containing protein [Planctomycetes bacterium]|nr:ATP-binding cassette domain-containing protein [Planctomycetota bacterium]